MGNYIARNSLILFIIQCASIGLVFLSNFVLVKLAGAAVYGSYVYLFNLIYFLNTACILGLDTLLLRKSAIYQGNQNFSALKGLFIFSGFALLISISIAALLFRFLPGLSGITPWKGHGKAGVFAFLTLGMLSVTTLAQSVLQGLKKIAGSQLGEKILRPLFLILWVVFLYLMRNHLTLSQLIWSNVMAIGIALVFALYTARIAIGKHLAAPIRATFENRRWVLAAAAFFLADILYNGNARIAILLLGYFKSKPEVGIFNISLRISELISFSLVVVNFVLSPLIAGLFAQNDRAALQKTITRSSRVILLIGTILFLGLVLFRHHILSLFGRDFESGQVALVILCLGQWGNIFFGSVGLLLIMTGHQLYSIYSLLVGILLNLGLNLWLTPMYGMTGTAIASASGLVGWNLVMYYFVRKKLRIRPTAFGNL